MLPFGPGGTMPAGCKRLRPQLLKEKTMFVVCGEALFDVFATGDTPTGLGLDARIGGSPFNVAVGLVRLGQPTAFMGGLSTGFLGERLLRAFRDEGVDERCLARLDAPTTLSLVGVDARGVPFAQAVVQSAAVRAQPIALTGLAAMMGAFFILDDPIFNGLAIALIFGIAVSTMLTLVVIPVLYYAVYRKRFEAAAA